MQQLIAMALRYELDESRTISYRAFIPGWTESIFTQMGEFHVRTKGRSVEPSGLKKGETVAGHFRILDKRTGERINVAVIVDKDEDSGPSYSQYKQKAKSFWEFIQRDLEATKSAQKLVNAGCDWIYLFGMLETYCYFLTSEFQKMERDRNSRLSKLSRKIGDFAVRIARLEMQIRDLNREIQELTGIYAHPHAPDFSVYDGVLAMAQTETLPKRNNVNIEKALLMRLCHLISKAAHRPHYSELAKLIAARTGRIVDSETLQTQIKRAIKQRKKLSDEFKKEVSDIVNRSPFWLCPPLPPPKQGT